MIEKREFGKTTAFGEPVMAYTLTAGDYSMTVSTYGGTILNLIVPDAHGRKADIVLGYKSLSEYEKCTTYFGALIGRFANRIKGGKFTIDGRNYQVPCNDHGINSLHGGPEGLNTKIWDVLTSEVDGAPALHMSYVSEDGEMGFPGTLKVHVDYILYPEGKLEMTYAAICDRTTPVNLTNHAYFNLAGDGSDVLNHELKLYCDKYLPVDDQLIPTGEVKSVEGTPFDFTSGKTIGKDIEKAGGYDHCMVLTTKGDHLKSCAYVKEPKSGRTMKVSTTMEGVQFYSGNFLDGSDTSRDGHPYTQYTGFCLETQHFPNAMNHKDFPNCLLHPGETYKHTTLLEFNI
ncbi:aldose epimerase family protein [Pleomorphochaeta sp. DL1XJH-081]|uniref:aldose epimerase family protein n=1 Tax=Pleomorphochaeta sp. DL1XJH-081 TaxID=3409690 RepID=UPI003BB688F1